MVSLVSNRGNLHNASKQRISIRILVQEVSRDYELMYHSVYLLTCLFGWLVHEFLYSILVRNQK